MTKVFEPTLLWLAMTAVAVNAQVFAQELVEPPPAGTYQETEVPAKAVFSVEQVEQMVAPVALYPDALLAQVFMAATYPLEVVQADQWLKKNPGLEGEALDNAVAAQPWDPSVKTLVFFPTVLERMAQDLTWTQDLGDAFLAQEADVMGAVQRLRRQAQEAGNLPSNSQQIVRTQGSNIVVESADPTVVYVPTYNPTVVYGSTWVPATTYYPATYSYVSTTPAWVVFGAGVLAGAVLTAAIDWADDDYYYVGYRRYPGYYRPHHHHHHIHHVYHDYWDRDWHGPRYGRPGWNDYRPAYRSGGDVFIDKSRTINVEQNFVKREWQHNPVHRRSVSYRDPTVARRILAPDAARQVDRDGARPLDREGLRTLDREGGQRLDGESARQREAMRRLDGSQPAMLPSDRTTREALQGDARERRERILRGQEWQAPSAAGQPAPDDALQRRIQNREMERMRPERGEAVPPQATTRKLERSAGTDADAATRALERARETRPSARPETGLTRPSASTRDRPEASPSPARVDPQQRLQRREPSRVPPQIEPGQVPQRRESPQVQQRAEPRQTPQAVERRQWQQPAQPRQVPQAIEPQEQQRQVQRQWQRQPSQSAEPRQAPPVQRSQERVTRQAPQHRESAKPPPQTGGQGKQGSQSTQSSQSTQNRREQRSRQRDEENSRGW